MTHMSKNNTSLKSWWIGALAVAVVAGPLLSGCTRKSEGAAAEDHIVTVDVAPVLNSTIQLKVSGDAVLYPAQQAAITPKVTAPVKKFFVDRGAHVHAGEVLAELESQDLSDAANESQAAYEVAEANYETAAKGTVPQEVQKADLDTRSAKDAMDAAQKLYDNRVKLLNEGAISQKDVNDAFVTLNQAKAQYEVAHKHSDDLQAFGKDQELKAAAAQRDVAKAHFETAQAQAGYGKIISPISGVVTDRPVYAGETPPNGGPFITIMDISHIIARTHISQREASLLKVGDPANLVPDGAAPIPGKVTQISAALDPASTTVEVWVEAANPNEQLRPGASMHLEMIAKTVENALVIPYAAVLTSSSGSTSVIVIDADNAPHKKSVTLGIRDGANVEVTDGLTNGDRVVTLGAFELAKLDPDVFDKTKVSIAPPKDDDDDDK
jgi:multidrug efflux pump subunit AcrA (membrane-fusion protein)